MDAIKFSDIISALVGVFGTALVGGIIYYIKSRRGNRIAFIKSQTKKLFSLEEIKGSDIKIQYKDEPIENLFITEFEIHNDGDKDLKDFEVIFRVGPKEKITYISSGYIDPIEKTKLGLTEGYEDKESNDLEFTLKRPHLNSRKRDKKETLYVSFLSDVEIDIFPIAGGEGWYIENLSYRSEQEKVKINKYLAILYVSFVFILGVYSSISLLSTYFKNFDTDLIDYVGVIIYTILIASTLWAIARLINRHYSL